MSLVQRLGISVFLVVITDVGLSRAAEAHSAHHDDHHHSRENKKKKFYNRGYKHGYRRAIENSYRHHYRTHYRSYSPLYGPMVSPMPQRHRHPNVLDGSCSPASPRHPRQRWARVPSLETALSTMSDRISNDASEAWRDYVLKQVVGYLETNREAIIDGFEEENAYDLKREEIEKSDLLDFDVSVTLHRDQSSSFGLGFGFFKANMIR